MPHLFELAFLDVRRLGRIRLCTDPLNEPPISKLGFDPILSMPNLKDFAPLVLKRKAPIKAVLLDQSFNAGVGNWVAGISPFPPFREMSETTTPCRRDPLPRTDPPRTTRQYAVERTNREVALLDRRSL